MEKKKIIELAVQDMMAIARMSRKPFVTRRANAIIEEFRKATEEKSEPKKTPPKKKKD